MRNVPVVVVCLIVFIAGSAAAGETARQREQRSADLKQLELRLQDINRRLDSLKDRGSEPKEETRRELARLQEDKKKKQEEAGKKMSQLGSATGQDFDRMKAEVNSAIEGLNNLYDRMSSLMRRT